MGRLEQFILAQASRTWADGAHDCALHAADWVLEARGFDPAAGWRGRYCTALGRERLLRREGGLVSIFSAIAARHGLPEREEADLQPGDVGVIRVMATGRRRPKPDVAAAIRFGARWSVFTPSGVHMVRAPLVRAWAI